ncbi:MAG: DMT family transporter [Sulfurovaceae bacterium]|nr:DMT family transporter [Sulfurovaceae bacterium]MDD5548353.1 DMT family transporter [Sulfurovaceae bacterium]
MCKFENKAVLLMLFASFVFAIMGGFVKVLSSSMGAMEITFFRNIIGVIFIVISLYNFPLNQEGGKPYLLLFRGLAGFFSLVAFFYILAFIPLGQAAVYNKISPIFVAIFAYLFLKEKLSMYAIVAIIIGFIGVFMVANPQNFIFSKYDILGLISGIGAALAYTSIRELRVYYETRSITLSFMIVGSIGPVIFMAIAYIFDITNDDFLFSRFVMPNENQWYLIAGVGVSATISQLLMTKAYSLSKAGIMGAISYSNIIFATIIGIVLGDKLPDFLTILGIILVIISGILVTKK